MSAQPCCTTGLKWLRDRGGKGHLAALTGQDMAALVAAIHVLDLYARADQRGSVEALVALRALVATIQPVCRVFVKEAIVFVLDDPAVNEIWPAISGEPS